MLLQKYGEEYGQNGKHDYKEAYSMLVAGKNMKSEINFDDALSVNGFKGEVDLFISKDDSFIRYPYYYNLHIDYTDALNGEKHQKQSLEDL